MKEKRVVEIRREKILGKRAGITYLQIFILILSSFAFCYLVNEATKPLSIEVKNEETSILSKIWEIISKPIFPLVSATALNCCQKTKSDDTCLDYESSQCQNECSGTCLPTSCDLSADCKKGCCYDSSEGLCIVNSPKVKCESDLGGIWKNNAECNVNVVPECRSGCCVLGSDVQFVTSARCQKLSGEKNLAVDFRAGITNEGECIALRFQDMRRACIFSDSSCKMLTNNECRSLIGRNVVPNYLCSSLALNTTCRPSNETTCLEGKDEVYFKDTCGNAANIYDSSKINNKDYWEKVIDKSEGCGASSANGNVGSKTCGNCFYLSGSKCKDYKEANMEKPDIGEKICADLSCKQAPDLVDAFGKVISKKDRKNGESWCVYDSAIGVDDKNTMSRDVVGSRHYRYSCIEGEVKVEPCADFRNEVCTESTGATVNGTRVEFSSAVCRINTWQSCIEVNTRGANVDKEEECKGEDCFVKKITIDSGFKFDICAPKSKEGFDLSSEGAMQTAEQVCKMATQTCTVLYKKKPFGGCVVAKNGNCLKAGIFTKQMNELCVSLGDCGGYVNIDGDYTDSGYTVKKVGKLAQKFIDEYKSYAKPVPGLKVVTDMANLAGQFGFPVDAGAGKDKESGGGSNTGFLLGLGAVGIGWAMVPASESVAGISGLGVLGGGAGFGGALIGAGIGMIVGGLMTKLLGVTDPGIAMAMTVIGGIAGAVVGYLAATGACGGTCLPIIIIAIIIMLILSLFGAGKCPPKKVTYTCMPWQPPAGGADCEKCNSGIDGLKTCSKYKCQSLGQACEFINEGSDNELCITKKNDGRAPVITPNYGVLSSNFSYMNVTSAGFSVRESNGKCIEAFSPLVFGINTDKAAQCKIDLKPTATFDEMEDYFGDSNLYLYNHTMPFAIPSVELALACGNDTNVSEADVMNQYKNLRIYTRCQDIFGNLNNNEYLVDVCARPGPDRTAPYITGTNPLNNANLGFNTTSKEVEIYTNEPASCKWSKQDKDYDLMENSFVCEDFCEPAVFGWKCASNLNNMTKGENTFYFRCKDQPWLEGTANESKRNANSQGYNYKLRVTETPLVIDRIIPDGTVTYGSLPGTFDLVVDTSGGVENGKAWCYYKWGANWILMQSDSVSWDFVSNSHFQTGMNTANFNVGANSLQIKCTDGGNEAYKNSTFNIQLDNIAPLVTRVYNSGGSLYILTNENSECAYSNSYQTCSFLFENGTQMNGGFTQEHTASWDTQQTYYIKCRDAWNNEPSSCSIRVKAYNDVAASFW
ncbi:MAG: hypothetical protein ABH840_03690 [Nanoarchaeota archaeon]